MEILLYQLFIVATLIVLRIFGGKALLIGALVWSCLTLINLFLPPLILVQLVVVWTTYGMLAPKEAAKSASLSVTSPTLARQPATKAHVRTPARPSPSPPIEVQADASSHIPRPTLEVAPAPLIRDGALAKRKAMLDLELAFANLVFGRAQARVSEARFISSADAETRQLYLDERAKRGMIASASGALAGGSRYDVLAIADTGGLAPVEEVVSEPWNTERKQVEWAHDAALKIIIDRLEADEDLQKAFRDVAAESGASRLIARLDSKSARFKNNLSELRSALAKSRYRRLFATPSTDAIKVASIRAEPKEAVQPPLQLEGSVVFPPDASAIYHIADSRAVPHLVHFTSVQNLASILEHGLHSVTDARAKGLEYVANDDLRLDRRLHTISTSLAFPNASMFWKCRQSAPASRWAVLLIDRSVLWRHECYFCRHNAADSRIIGMAAATLMEPNSFAAMFDEVEGLEGREGQNLEAYDPTDPQAEVMVIGVIPPEAITAIAFNDAALAREYAMLAPGRSIHVHENNGGYFGQRAFVRARGGRS